MRLSSQDGVSSSLENGVAEALKQSPVTSQEHFPRQERKRCVVMAWSNTAGRTPTLTHDIRFTCGRCLEMGVLAAALLQRGVKPSHKEPAWAPPCLSVGGQMNWEKADKAV